MCLLVIGCSVRSYELGGKGGRDDAGSKDDGGGGGNDGGGTGDGGIDAPPCTMPHLETCNQQDDDCDGKIDEGFNLTADPANCGMCGHACSDSTNTMAGSCESSQCVFTCLPGKVDLDPNVAGCEYTCTPTNNGNESCDFVDNDCDGMIDDGVDTITDVNNCGGCGQLCAVLNAVAACADIDSDGDGDCTFSACNPGYADLLSIVPGCEYACPVTPSVPETCNFVDDDCDGMIDDGTLPGVGDNCTDPGKEALGDTGHCTFGTKQCLSGSLVCIGYVGPLANAPGGKEFACNTEDDDCDGATDEGYVLASDVHHCGSCANDCTLPGVVPNAVPKCQAGACGYVACQQGWVDTDPMMPGCDYQCTKTGTVDVCDGVDNDCDRSIDEDYVTPTGFCRTAGACSSSMPVCSFDPCKGKTRIHCVYGAGVEVDPTTCDVVTQENRCDNVDNDCDNAIDESFPAKGTTCDDGDIGTCKQVGSYRCNAMQNGVACDFSMSPPDQQPVPETCNALDDDCDGTLDEDVADEMVTVTNTMNQPLYKIYKYEASRPDATMLTVGTASHRSCSRPLVVPWSSVTETQAAAACAAAGKRLCTASEWERACEGPMTLQFPYGNTYQPNACNGNDYDVDCALPDSDGVLPTGTAYGCPTKPAQSVCVSPWGAFDMSGNLKEWTSTQTTPGAFNIRGGAFDTAAGGLACRFSFISAAPTFSFSNLGFRCCEDP